jgi:hypothetical protein
MAVVHHFRQQEVVLGEVVGFRVVNHIRSRHTGYLDTVTDMSV